MNKSSGQHAIFNFNQITTQIYLGTNLCCTLKPHIQILLDLGIDADIDLEEERQKDTPRIETYLWLPVKDKQAPTQTQLEIGVSVVDKLIKNGKKVYIHCKNGHGRSPTLLAAYFVFQGLSPDEAVKKIRAKRQEIHLEEVQKKAIRLFANTTTQ